MRAILVVLTLISLLFAGCAAEESPTAETPDESFDDVEVEVTDDTGAIRGVVVNDAIVPVADALVELALPTPVTTKTDAEGRFTFSKVAPGTYFMTVSKVVHESAQASVTVVAGEKLPDIVKVQLQRLYDQDPYYETLQYAGFLGCAIAIVASTTCVNDYTRLCGNVDPSCCPGGCAPQVTGVVDQREYRSEVGGGWQSIVWELVWDSSLTGTAEELGLTVSYATRQGASHWYTSAGMGAPFRLQCDVNTDCREMSTDEANPEGRINPEGQDDLWNMIGAGSGVALQQDIEIFQNNFYYAPAPEEWSFVRGDPSPF